MQDIATKLCEMGWLYRKIQIRLKTLDSNTVSLCEQSFLSEIKLEMHDYYRLIAILESHTAKGETLSLKRLLIWTASPLARLRIVSVLMDVCKDVTGGAIVSTIHNYAVHGDPLVHDYIINLLAKVF